MTRDPEEIALLAAIYADLDADGPRHVYADWLLARGDQRGALINVQCWLERAPLGARAELQREERRLYRWYGPHPVLPGGYCRTVRRGFLAAVTVTSIDEFVDGNVLAALPTVEEVAISGCPGPGALQKLLAARGMERLRELCLCLHPEAAGVLAGAPLRGLRLEKLTRPALAALTRALASGPPLSRLPRLTVGGEALTAEDLVALLGRLPHLTSLTLRECSLNAEDLLEMAEHPSLASLAELGLPRYLPASAPDTWQIVLQWLGEHLGDRLKLS